jgi:hypothetical protein
VNPKHYILNDDGSVEEVDLITWAEWLEYPSNRIVGYTQITSQIWVSTVFIGLDHRFTGWPPGPPILFETMIFGGPLNQYQWRYSSHDDAISGHAAAVKRARAAIGQRVTA